MDRPTPNPSKAGLESVWPLPRSAIALPATAHAAALLHTADRGTIAPGKRVDLLVVDGDPSRDIAANDRIVETGENGTAVAGAPAAR